MMRAVLLFAAALLAVATPRPVMARDYLDTGEALAVGGVSTGLLLLGLHLRQALSPAQPRWTEPSAVDLWAARHLAPPPRAEHRNFMQHKGADTINVIGNGLLLAAVDLTYPVHDDWRDTGQDQLLYWSGLAALSGVQAAVKGAVGRQRPLARLHPDLAAARDDDDDSRDQRSFWSGHASSAFYASAFLNLRLREVMRREMSADDYTAWRWAPPTLLYAWAGWVAYSRVHGYEHWLSDVLVGAAAGWGFAQVFYALDDRSDDADPGAGVAKSMPLFRFAVWF